jgi:hypothetical protein
MLNTSFMPPRLEPSPSAPFLKEPSMWVYKMTDHYLWTVGFYDPKGQWHTDSDHSSSERAAERVAWLNGSGPSGMPLAAARSLPGSTEDGDSFEEFHGS